MDQQQTPNGSRGVSAAPAREKNGPWGFLFMVLAVFAGMYWLSMKFGPDAPWQFSKAAIGLGLVIFLHELGHFAVAKWCDVHVETFSLGFGPAIPGLSFRRGETLYKIAWIPLGGYVKMVGEGAESEEDDTDPRSFKNKTVGQRMAIISAGVVMNIILGCVCFILAYQGGIKQAPAVVGLVEPGSPAWQKNVRSGQVIEHIGSVEHPYFKDLLFEVMLSREGQELRMVVARPGPNEKPHDFKVTPRRDASDSKPVIGIAPPESTAVITKKIGKRAEIPPAYGPTAAARALTLRPDDVVVATSDPKHAEQMLALPPPGDGKVDRTNFEALCQRFLAFMGKPLTVEIRHVDGTMEKQELAASGIEYGDVIVGTTMEKQGSTYDPYQTAELKDDPRNPEPGHPDYFEFSKRMQVLAGKPVVLQMRRAGMDSDDTPVDVLVPPAYHQVIPGVRMKMGKVRAVRAGSAAEAAGVRAGDRILGVELTDDAQHQTLRVLSELSGKPEEGVVEKHLDPTRLAFDLHEWVGDREGVKAAIIVARDDSEQHKDGARRTLPLVAWNAERRFDQEAPLVLAAPLSIPELGVAYQVDTLVDAVTPGSAADGLLQAGDVVQAVAFKEAFRDAGKKWSQDLELYEKKNEREPWWARVAAIYSSPDVTAIQLKVRRGTEERVVELDLQPDDTWPLRAPCLRLMADTRVQKADGPLQAVSYGVTGTYQMIVKTYLSLRNLITNRVSVMKNLHGPITIGVTAFELAGEDLPQFMFFLAIISVNLAVINFLPIPVLDGGHMVFLIYEKLRGRPANEQVRVALTTIGVVFILSLMAFVIILDVSHFFNG